MPEVTFLMQAQAEDIHVGSWPVRSLFLFTPSLLCLDSRITRALAPCGILGRRLTKLTPLAVPLLSVFRARSPLQLTPAFGNTTSQSAIGMQGYESAEVITALAKVYAVYSNAAVVQSSIGTSVILPGGSNQDWTLLEAEDDMETEPIVYRSVDGTNFGKKTYDVDGEISWGTLQGINDAWPAYIPKVQGSLVPHRENKIEDLRALQQ